MSNSIPSLFDRVEEPAACTVSQLTAQLKSVIESGFSSVWVVGEISSLKVHTSGHVYLTLKDARASLSCVIWRSTAQRLKFELGDGMEVFARGQISVYEAQGKYQLYIDQIQPKGLGARDIALRKLKERLAKLGYFDPQRKKPLPRFPRRLALVTSPSGAAVRDMLEILARRWPMADVLICPVRVQGTWAAEDITLGLYLLNRLPSIDVILLGRGGGSAEDLAPFNEEIVANAIFQSRVPVVSAVGHEIDVTIADLVADRRALTPSEAAEIATPDRRELWRNLRNVDVRLRDLIEAQLAIAKQGVDDLAKRRVLRLPLERLHHQERQLDDWDDRLGRGMRALLERRKRQAEALAGQLQSLSPLNVLARGYSLTRTLPDQRLVHTSEQVQPGDAVEVLLAHGRLVARVEESNEPDASASPQR
ncbi:MAG: exodeoxyribonuclease VII large subunit [Gemmataceae bacterium]|nr:exodeoxyribonuclease VII large subunit [Gemmataceae bacterium]MCI0742952.1 exodeoxyribonuclease VII large subunit [Gemmataceae bacterium]